MTYSWYKDLLGIPKEQILLYLYEIAIMSPNEVHIDKRPTLSDAKSAIVNALQNNNGKITEFLDEKINVDFSDKEFDFSEFEKQYGIKAVAELISKCQINGIERNNYLNNLIEEASIFNIYGQYIEYFDAKDPLYNGIYFVCGYDKDKILNKKIDIEEIVKTQNERGCSRMDIHAEKLIGGSPFAIHQQIVHYCLNASTIRTLTNKHQLSDKITTCSNQFINNIGMLCRQINDSNLSPAHKQQLSLTLQDFFRNQGEIEIQYKGKGEETADTRIFLEVHSQ